MSPLARPFSRRLFLRSTGLGAVGVALVGGGVVIDRGVQLLTAAPRPPAAQGPSIAPYRSRPDLLPPPISITVSGPAAPGYIFLTPANGQVKNGPLIIDDQGELVWMRPDKDMEATNLRVAMYRGQPVLTWWQGDGLVGYGHGEYIVADATYRHIATVKATGGYFGDLHDFVLTPQGTGLMTIFGDTVGGVPTYRGLAHGPLIEGVVQEIDVATGDQVFQWRSSDHVPSSESYLAVPKGPGEAYDYFHINSVDEAGDGDLLVSARHTWCVYKIRRTTGEVVWRLGGTRSDFRLGPGVRFAWQHDARHQEDGTLSIFDDGAHGPPPQFEKVSRGIVLRLDEAAGRASLVRAYSHPDILAASQGSMQVLDDGHAFLGWGNVAAFTEYDADGTIVVDGTFPGAGSYRAFRFPWVGRPADPPDIAVVPRGDGIRAVYASWNGATEATDWQLLVGEAADSLTPLASSPREGFETAFGTRSTARLAAVRALGSDGAVLGTSKPVDLAG
ncbi:MAG TPA: arylsulfotransferase family protein [Candidatus Limnocylindrales bacterium]|nr:arylsulfotransferase family protein [Candidatus Limnocylindrales bacterium]